MLSSENLYTYRTTMPVSIDDGIVDEKWALLYDGETITLNIKNSAHPHSLKVSNKNGFK